MVLAGSCSLSLDRTLVIIMLLLLVPALSICSFFGHHRRHVAGQDAAGEPLDPRAARIPGFQTLADGDPILMEDLCAPPVGLGLSPCFQYGPRQLEMHEMMKKCNQSKSRLHCVIGPSGIGKSELAKAVC